ncbi:MAG: N-acetylmuramoyl-L-alanine amidase [Candidatus Poribacteria bacterium]
MICLLLSCGAITRNIGFGLSESEVEKLYKDAESLYNSILDGKVEPSAKNWNDAIKQFEKIVKDHPKSKFADSAQYNTGQCYIWANSVLKDSPQKAIKAFDYLISRYPNSKLIDEAYYWRAYAYSLKSDYKRAIQEYERFKAKFPNSDLYQESLYQIRECKAKLGISVEYAEEDKQSKDLNEIKVEAEKKPKNIKQKETKPEIKTPYEDKKSDQRTTVEMIKPIPIPEKPQPPLIGVPESKTIPSIQEKKDERSIVKNIRFNSSSGVTRVVLDISKSAKYESGKLENPIRLYIDVKDAIFYPSKQNITIDDGIVKSIRVSQYDDNTVRIVLDLKNLKNYKIFSLDNPTRIAIDIYGQKEDHSKSNGNNKKDDSQSAKPKPSAQPKDNEIKKPYENNAPTLVKQLGLKVRTIVIDPGHGGKDPGAMSKFGLCEKDIVLDIAKRLKNLLSAKGIYNVYMTRDSDIFIPLEDRTEFANKNGADLFISIHINSSPGSDARGIETYYLSLASDDEAKMTAALENASSEKGIKEMGILLSRILKTAKVAESKAFASITQFYLCKKTDSYNRGVKKAPFIVLIGANAPSILVELGFMSNQNDVELLKSDEYKDKLADALMNSIEEYIKMVNSTG